MIIVKLTSSDTYRSSDNYSDEVTWKSVDKFIFFIIINRFCSALAQFLCPTRKKNKIKIKIKCETESFR